MEMKLVQEWGIDGFCDICFLDDRIMVGPHSLCENENGVLTEYTPTYELDIMNLPLINGCPDKLFNYWLKRCNMKKNKKTGSGSGPKKVKFTKEQLDTILTKFISKKI